MAKGSVKILALLVCVSLCAFNVAAAGSGIFSVSSYGAKGDSKTDDAAAFMKAWKEVCASTGSAKLQIPKGVYYTGPIKFAGPCTASPITIELLGTLKASTDLSKFAADDAWVLFSGLKGLTLTGGGTFDGQGSSAWKQNSCHLKKDCKVLPVSVKFMLMNDTTVSGIRSVDPKFFHIGVIDSTGFHASGVTIKAPEDSPNTDGMHIERSSDVTITDTSIGTGDDCISIGHGNTNLFLKGIKCGPGHGISVGSLGRYNYEKDVKGLVVRDSDITGTQNGVRIKTYEDSASSITASNMTFENINMHNVFNPIIIDQNYCPFANCDSKSPSKVKLSDVKFIGIKGTSATPEAVTLKCSSAAPCSKVVLQNIQLTSSGGTPPTLVCANVSPSFSGTVAPNKCTAVTKK